LANSNLPTDNEGDIDYVSIANAAVIYDNEYLLTYDDTTIAYIFHSMVTGAYEASDDEDSMEFLRKIGADIKEVTIAKDTEGTTLRVVIKIDLTSLKTQIQSALGSVASYLPVPSSVFIVSYSTLTADENGLIVTTGSSIKINDTDNAVSAAIFSVLASEAENQGGESDTALINDKMGEAFAVVIKHLGKVGTANTDTNGIVVPGTKVLGETGVSDHALTLITNTEENYTE